MIESGTSKYSQKELLNIVSKNFDLRPGKIVKDLKLRTPFYQRTSTYGHFGREGFPWEEPKELVMNWLAAAGAVACGGSGGDSLAAITTVRSSDEATPVVLKKAKLDV